MKGATSITNKRNDDQVDVCTSTKDVVNSERILSSKTNALPDYDGREEGDGGTSTTSTCTSKCLETTTSNNEDNHLDDVNSNRNSNNNSNNRSDNDNDIDNDNDSSNNDESTSDAPPSPKYQIKQKVLARDTDTPLLYEAVVRKIIYAPKSKQVRVCNLDLVRNKNNSSDGTGGNDNDIGDGNCSVNGNGNGGAIDDDLEEEENLDALLDLAVAESITNEHNAWHYFVHYQGWNVKWDRWVEEEKLFHDTDSSRILAKRLKEESKCLKKRPKPSDKVVLEVMQRMRMLEKEFREKEARGEVLTFDTCAEEDAKKTKANEVVHANVDTNVNVSKKKTARKITTSTSTTPMTNKQTTARFIQNEVRLRRSDLCSKKPPNDLEVPFPIKKILVHEWEVISQCGMLHCLPAINSVSVMDALNAYYEGKIRMLRNRVPLASNDHNPIEEKKDDSPEENISSSTGSQRETVSNEAGNDTANDNTGGDGNDDGSGNANSNSNGTMQAENPEEQRWKDMSSGLAMFFDHVLPNKLLYRHELPQCLVLQEKYESKRFCELYSCEYMLRLCLKLPDLVADSKDILENEKSEINFKLGDFLRFLQKHQDTYILQRYRKPDADETEKAKKLQSRLGLVPVTQKTSTESKKDAIVDGDYRRNEKNDYLDGEEKKRKRKGGVGPAAGRKKKKIFQEK